MLSDEPTTPGAEDVPSSKSVDKPAVEEWKLSPGGNNSSIDWGEGTSPEAAGDDGRSEDRDARIRGRGLGRGRGYCGVGSRMSPSPHPHPYPHSCLPVYHPVFSFSERLQIAQRPYGPANSLQEDSVLAAFYDGVGQFTGVLFLHILPSLLTQCHYHKSSPQSCNPFVASCT
ncbi:uncharacterized protein EI90DRAFT_3052897 [Cantharellus anzutake]|uniref:uncharacterized protein n=1 Tax=Cantharellus anzutake TaxID=1750568 RepID=UPI00190312BB|nr:uncharacterized protein EI90DRAFT_3052897 [Cantharellus anzutake]KAF8333076.1 hypothetical protein EI90DRAFT_3052897 [Cantharellus anzutake]